MPFAPSVQNYQVGGMAVVLGGIDMGNIVSAELNAQDVTVIDHFTARSGDRKLDDRRVVQKRLFFRFSLDEHQSRLYTKYFMGTTGPDEKIVDVMKAPLAETNILVTYRNVTGIIWTFSHSRANTRPSAAMNFGEFNNYVRFDIDVEMMEDATQLDATGQTAPFGILTFTTL